MSTDYTVTKALIQTLEDGRKGFAKGAEQLMENDEIKLAETFRAFETQRAEFAAELETLAAAYGDDIDESGSAVAAMHRGWMTVIDALSGSSADGVLGAAETGESHTVGQYDQALLTEISPELRDVISRQYGPVRNAHDTIAALSASSV
ncbi:MAG: PA2169 family four-helix-bundle protein [Ilumatobacter sp.]|jgi:uncharacterized protein (TIGR02284 family)|uniref:PA2169 family four-helix-bundle protein n=1 Tax=Ilumatobacter sp. TaxID=1967498 RepID=UPI00391AD4AD